MDNFSAIFFGLSILDILLVLIASVATFVLSHRYFEKKAGQKMNNFLINSLVNEQDQYIAFIDIKGNIVLANKSFEDLVGLPSSKLIGNKLKNLPIQQDVADAFTRNDDKIFEGKSTIITYNQSILRNKETCWLQIQKRTLLLKNPDVTYVLLVATDISEKKMVEEQLSFTKNEYKQLVESAGDIIFRTDLSGSFMYVNSVVYKILEYSEEEILKMKLEDLICQEDVEKINDFYDSKFSGLSHEGYVEFRVLTKSGEIKWLGQSVTKIVKRNETVGFQSVARDITAMKIAQTKLRNAKQIAEEASEAKSNFIASMSHEFRTPLNAIIGYSQILERNNSMLTEEKEHIQEIRKGGEQILGMIDDILALSVLDSNKTVKENEEMVLSPFIENFANRYSRMAREQGLSFYFKKPARAPEILNVDIDKLSVIIKNLLDNAIKFTQKGFVELSYEVIFGESEDAILSVTVKDTGIGISEEHQVKLFEPFWQLDPLKYSGTGLGLTLIKRLVNFLEGEIKVESSLEYGSGFYLQIPVEVPKNHGQSTTLNGFSSHTEMTAKRNGKIKALIVDDLDANRTITRIVLSENGIDYREAEDGAQALQIMEEYDPDVILMDINMPVMDGIEAMRHIRSKEWKFKDHPVIAVTAGAKGSKAELLEKGFSDYILKPFKEQDLLFSIFNLL
ncbi:MAG: PAS domain S-box protein, partial [Balneolales bacterium]|nr:PAS domain S-box protein [Balneolales bacterium]